jgi:hypothetical protein
MPHNPLRIQKSLKKEPRILPRAGITSLADLDRPLDAFSKSFLLLFFKKEVLLLEARP